MWLRISVGLAAVIALAGCQGEKAQIYSDKDYNSKVTEVTRVAEPLINKAYALLSLTDAEKEALKPVVKDLRALIDYNPGSAPLYLTTAQCYYASGDLEQALLFVDQGIGRIPEKPSDKEKPTAAELDYVASLCLFQQKHFQLALEAADRAIKNMPERGAYHSARGAALLQLKRDEMAHEALLRALRLTPKDPQANKLIKLFD